MNIVLVDDDSDYRELTALALQGCGVRNIREFDGPRTALSMLGEWKASADLVLLDYHLPGTTGLALMRKLRSLGCDAPVALLSAADLDEDRCTLEGALAVLKKPCGGADDLAESLQRLTLEVTGRRAV